MEPAILGLNNMDGELTDFMESLAKIRHTLLPKPMCLSLDRIISQVLLSIIYRM